MGIVTSIIPGAPTGDFSTEDWTGRIAVLRAAEPEFRKSADAMNLHLLSSARWPELRLQRKRGLSITELRLTLRPSDSGIRADDRRWSINLVRYPRFAWLPLRPSSVETISVLSDREVSSGGWMQDCFQDAVRRLSGR